MIDPLRTDDQCGVTTQHIMHTQQQAIGSSSCRQQVLDELDDPNELWRRPHSMWVTQYDWHSSDGCMDIWLIV